MSHTNSSIDDRQVGFMDDDNDVACGLSTSTEASMSNYFLVLGISLSTGISVFDFTVLCFSAHVAFILQCEYETPDTAH